MGDHDVQGADIETNTRSVIEKKTAGLNWERPALTQAQVEEHRIPALEKLDKRTGITSQAYETEALSQIVIQDLLVPG